MTQALAMTYRSAVLGHPRTVLALLLAVLAFFAWHVDEFRLDASADSLLLDGDPDLALFREVQARYRTRPLLLVTFTPAEDLFSDPTLGRLADLRDSLEEIEGVHAVTSILDVPLLTSSDVSLTEMATNVQTLESPTIDRSRAREELRESVVFKKLLLSEDARTTAILVELREDERLARLLEERNALRAKKRAGGLDGDEARRLAEVSASYDTAHDALGDRRHGEIAAIRDVVAHFEPWGTLHLGGLPMITDDMVTFIKRDLVVFGAGVFVFVVIVLGVIFAELRWVVLPLLGCVYASVLMIGLLGLVGWRVTVISSNFLALMLIITISMNIHLAVRYRQLARDNPDMGHADLVHGTTRRMVWPCLYTALTTIMGFSSLVFSDIKPVIDFGWMMSIGLAVTFATSFTLFPAVLLLLGERTAAQWKRREFGLFAALAGFTERRGGLVLVLAAALAVVSAVGISRLTVENSFIDYFDRDTEIYRGMKLIDDELGGTTPFDVLLDLDEDRIFGPPEEARPPEGEAPDPDIDLVIEMPSDPEEAAQYWFTDFRIERIKAVHDYLESIPEIGKVLSLASIIRAGEEVNDGQPFDSLELAILYKRIPADLKETLIQPYVSIADNEARLFLRVRDSMKDLRRKELLERIRRGLFEELDLGEADVSVSGPLVLYNNMLQSLYRSQISTLGVVLAGVAAMFLVLFRSVTLAVIGIVPNVLAACAVLGIMGLAGIPLDMMTITVAAVSIGIAVDNSIHYIYRFREEFAKSGSYVETLRICHLNIGRAILYTSATIVFGFSILVLSNFYPTIYFGVLTGLAMLIALLAALTLLPKLILVTRPFG